MGRIGLDTGQSAVVDVLTNDLNEVGALVTIESVTDEDDDRLIQIADELAATLF